MGNSTKVELVKRAFKQYEYRLQVVVGGDLRFNKVIFTRVGPFTIQFYRIREDADKLPLARVLEMPDDYKDQLVPHLMPGGHICFLDEQTTNLNPLDIGGFFATCIERVEAVVCDWVSGKSRKDIPAEFLNYWGMSDTPLVYIISEKPKVGSFYKRHLLNGRVIDQLIFGDDETSVRDWAEKSFDLKSRTGGGAPVCSVELTQEPYVPYSVGWPIDTTEKYFDWLKIIDSQAFGVLLSKIAEIGAQSLIFIKMAYQADVFGVAIMLSGDGEIKFSNISRKIQKHSRLSPRQKKKKSSLVTPKDLLPVLRNPKNTVYFSRLIGQVHTEDFIVERNTPDESLGGTRIALIGAGTIGGYVAQSLVQVGAGYGGGSLEVFDPDEFHSENIGRHLLTNNLYLGESKGEALVHHLSKVFSIAKLQAVDRVFSKSDVDKRWDIIIDATGDTRFSLMLSKWYRDKEPDSTLIHGWITAYGGAVRALVDDKKYACYSCIALHNDKLSSERFPLFLGRTDTSDLSSFHRQCGKSYQAFSSQPGMTAAGLIVKSVLDRHKSTLIRFRQINLDDRVLQTRDQNAKPAKACPVCSKN